MKNIPSDIELMMLPDLVPKQSIIDHMLECINTTDKHQRKSTVTVTYEMEWDEENQRQSVFVKLKSKRPVRSDRNEEIIGDRGLVFSIGNDVPGQQRMDMDGLRGVSVEIKRSTVETECEPVGKDAAAKD